MSTQFACAESEIQNVSGRTLAYVSIFGRSNLADGETFTLPGDPWAWLAGRYPGIKGRRMIEKFRDLINQQILSIVSMPSAPCGGFESSSSFVQRHWSSSSQVPTGRPGKPWWVGPVH
jgi:hypothetical protein